MRRNENPYHFFTDEGTLWNMTSLAMGAGVALGLTSLAFRCLGADQASESGALLAGILILVGFSLSPGNPFYQQIREAQERGHRALGM